VTGKLTRVLSSRLYKNFPDKNIIDMGSISDMFIVETSAYERIMVRTHIRKDKERIKALLKEYL